MLKMNNNCFLLLQQIRIRKQKQMSSLSEQKLQKALKQGKNYKDTQPFLDAISQDNEKVIPIINKVFIHILQSQKVDLMSKLLVLRMYKDIFMLGNMKLFDMIDQQVQSVIIEAAAYNPKFKSKGKNDKQTRGGMLYIQKEKRPKNNTNIQLSNSIVLFSTQIIKYFAEWFPNTPDGETSRFADAYEELKQIQVPFNTKIYLQPQQGQKFKANYAKWLKSQQQEHIVQKQNQQNHTQKITKNVKQIQKEYQNKLDSKQKLIQDKIKTIISHQEQLQKYKNDILDLNKLISQLKSDLSKQEEQNKSLKDRQQQIKNSKIKQQQLSTIKSNQKTQKINELQAQIKKLKEQNTKNSLQAKQFSTKLQILTKENQKLLKIINKAKSQPQPQNHKNNKQIQLINSLQQFKQENQKLTEQNKRLLSQLDFMKQNNKQSELSNKVEKLNEEKLQISGQNQNLKVQINTLKQNNRKLKLQSLRNLKDKNKQKDKQKQKQNQTNNIITKNKNEIQESLKQQVMAQKQINLQLIKKLQENKNKIFTLQAQIQCYKEQIKQVSSQKQTLQQTINSLNTQIKTNDQSNKQSKQKVLQSKQNQPLKIDTIIQNTSNIQQEKLKSLNYNEIAASTEENYSPTNFYNIKVREPSLSLSKILGVMTPQQYEASYKNYNNTANNFYKTDGFQNFGKRKSSNSMNKTQYGKPKSKIQKQNSRLLSSSNSYGTFFRTENILTKKNINLKTNQNKINMTSIFPFIPQYFQPVNIVETSHFRACSASQLERKLPFFANQYFQMKINKYENSQKEGRNYSLIVKSKLQVAINIKIQSQTSQMNISNGNNYKRVQKFAQIEFQIQAHITNLNFRIPYVNISINDGRNQKQFKIGLPLTLYNFAELSQSVRKIQKFENSINNSYKKHRSQRVLINKTIKALPLTFQQLIFETKENESLKAKIYLTFPSIPEIKLKLTMIQSHQNCQFETQFASDSKISQNFSKVILQAFMFIVV